MPNRRANLVDFMPRDSAVTWFLGETTTTSGSEPHQRSEQMGECGFSDAGLVLNQQMATGQQASEREADFVGFANHHAGGATDDFVHQNTGLIRTEWVTGFTVHWVFY